MQITVGHLKKINEDWIIKFNTGAYEKVGGSIRTFWVLA